MRIAPDINNPFPTWQGGGNGGGNNNGGGQGGGNGPKARFMPGQINALAQGMQMSQGGNVDKYKNYLKSIYDPVNLSGGFNFSGGGHGGGGNGGGNNNPDPRNPGNGGGNNNGGQGGFTPTSPRNHMAMPMGGGLLSMPQQMPQQQGLLGDIDPAVLAYITSGMRR